METPELTTRQVTDMELNLAEKQNKPAHPFTYETNDKWVKEIIDTKIKFAQWQRYL